MSTTTLLVLPLPPAVGLLVLAVPGYLVWRHPLADL